MKKTVYAAMLPSPEMGLPVKKFANANKQKVKDFIEANKAFVLPFEFTIEKFTY